MAERHSNIHRAPASPLFLRRLAATRVFVPVAVVTAAPGPDGAGAGRIDGIGRPHAAKAWAAALPRRSRWAVN